MTNTVYSMLWKAAISLIFMLGHYHGETFKIHYRNYFMEEEKGCLMLAATVSYECRSWYSYAISV